MAPMSLLHQQSVQKRQIVVDQTRKFAVVLEPEQEGGFTVRVPALPEIVTHGKNEEEALAMAEDAIRLVLEDVTARGESAPTPCIREVTVTLAA
jgi:antitoxin HicB